MIKRWTWLLPGVFLLWWFKTTAKTPLFLQDGPAAEAVRLDDEFLLVRLPAQR